MRLFTVERGAIIRLGLGTSRIGLVAESCESNMRGNSSDGYLSTYLVLVKNRRDRYLPSLTTSSVSTKRRRFLTFRVLHTYPHIN